MSGGSPIRALVLAATLAACARSEPAPAPAAGSVPVASPDTPIAEATSPDGRHRLRVLRVDALPWQTDAPVRRVQLLLRVAGLSADELPGRREGVDRSGRPEWTEVDWRCVEPLDGCFFSTLEVPAGAERLAGLRYEIPILRVRSWEPRVFEVPGAEMASSDAPCPLTAETGPWVCGLRIRERVDKHLVPGWAMESAEVSDARGARLTPLVEFHGSYSWYAPAEVLDGMPPLIAYPVSVRYRVPGEHAVEHVAFAFDEIPLSAREPRPGGAPVDSPDSPDADATAWSEWSTTANGLSLQVRLPGRVVRGDRVTVRARLRIDPDGLSPEVTHFDARCFEDRLRLHFRDPRTGARVDLEDDDESERVIETVDMDSSASAPEDPLFFPVRPGAVPEREVRFLLARAWDALGPGDWRVSASLEEREQERAPCAWAGRAETEPIALRIEDAAPRRMRVCVPTALRLQRGRKPGSVDVCYGAGQAELVEIEARNGFFLGTMVQDEQEESSSWGHGDFVPHVHEQVDMFRDLAAGPLDRTYRFEIFESVGNPIYAGVWPTPKGNGFRVLWTRTLRVTATAEEVEALRR